ncbi:MAG: TetR/AcrR family transcriptional regulator [Acidimicrobiia bacterium]
MSARHVSALPAAAVAEPERKVGRPRRFDPATEVEMICDAALALMQRGDHDLTVTDILAEAGMSTRSFYRHFTSKDELLCALYRRDATRAAARLEAKVAAAPTPIAALEAWVNEIVSFGLNEAKAKRVAALGSMQVMKAEGIEAEALLGAELIASPLVAILRAGKADGSFLAADPEPDAEFIRAITWAAAGLSHGGVTPGRPKAQAVDDVLGFCRRALGCPPT